MYPKVTANRVDITPKGSSTPWVKCFTIWVVCSRSVPHFVWEIFHIYREADGSPPVEKKSGEYRIYFRVEKTYTWIKERLGNEVLAQGNEEVQHGSRILRDCSDGRPLARAGFGLVSRWHPVDE
jgi:hypothetical protein